MLKHPNQAFSSSTRHSHERSIFVLAHVGTESRRQSCTKKRRATDSCVRCSTAVVEAQQSVLPLSKRAQNMMYVHIASYVRTKVQRRRNNDEKKVAQKNEGGAASIDSSTCSKRICGSFICHRPSVSRKSAPQRTAAQPTACLGPIPRSVPNTTTTAVTRSHREEIGRVENRITKQTHLSSKNRRPVSHLSSLAARCISH